MKAELFGVSFTPAQWAAAMEKPPIWHLDPPQREQYENDHDYTLGMRAYADRVIKSKLP